jgi:cytochrome c peroxidase
MFKGYRLVGSVAFVVSTSLGCTAGSVGPTTTEGSSDAEEQTVRAALAGHSPSEMPAPPEDPTNRFANDDRAAALGQRFFFDPGFSGELLDSDNNGDVGTLGMQGETGKVACVGCHVPDAGFVDNRSPPLKQVPLGAGWGLRRARPLLDVGHAKLLMWDGRRDALHNQVFTPFESELEMNSARLFIALEIFRRYRAPYEALFGSLSRLEDVEAFPRLTAAQAGCHASNTDGKLECHGKPGDGAEYDGMSAENQTFVTGVVVNVGKAIAAYERRLSCGPGRFDEWMHGNAAALTPEEIHGAALFVRAGCASCHAGPHFTDQRFHNVGLEPGQVNHVTDSNDRGAAVGLQTIMGDHLLNTQGLFSDGYDGRLPNEVGPEMEGAFRTPSLRCVSKRPSFMHTGQYLSLDLVVDFFSRGGDPAGYPGKSENEPHGYSPEDVQDVVAFLKTLDGPGADEALRKAP